MMTKAPNICMEIFMENGDYYGLVVTEDYELLDWLGSGSPVKNRLGKYEEE